MLTRTQSSDIPREQVVAALVQLRQEWQVAAAPKSLAKTKANVGLMLSDVAMLLGLDSIERIQVLGGELTRDIEDVLNTTVSLK
jgi:hypothetical protein